MPVAFIVGVLAHGAKPLLICHMLGTFWAIEGQRF